MKLFPRLPNRFALEVYGSQSGLPLEQIEGSPSHRLMIWPATGADRVSGTDLLELRTRLRIVADAHDYPAPLSRSDQTNLDLDLARVLWADSDLAPAEAGFADVWSFLALVLVPEIVWWRAAGSTNVERFVATDLTRHTLARLWWRAQLFTWGLEDPESGWDLWRTSPIGEAELDQIQTRRSGYGRSPRAFRSLVTLYPTVVALADGTGMDRRTFWRQAYLRWLLRLGAFTNFSAMPEAELRDDLLELAHEVAAAGALIPTSPDIHAETAAEQVAPTEITEVTVFDALPLETLVVHLAEAVRASGEVMRENLASAFEHVSGIAVPPGRAEILAGIAWQGQRLNYLVNTGSDTKTSWRSGAVLPAADRRWGDWSIDSFKSHVAGLNGGGEFAALCAELFNGRAGTTVKRIVRAAMDETTRKGTG